MKLPKLSPEARLSAAESEIRYLTGQIEYHDAEASRLRKSREGFKAKSKRAREQIERSATSKKYESK